MFLGQHKDVIGCYYTQSKVIERATGCRNAEEWKFLPDNWNYDIDRRSRTIFSKNFLHLQFKKNGDDLLFMNLISRKQFWTGENELFDQVKLKMDGVDADGVPIRELGLRNLALNSMNANAESIAIRLTITCYRYVQIGES